VPESFAALDVGRDFMGQAQIRAATLGIAYAEPAARPIPLFSSESNIDGLVHDSVLSSGLARFRLLPIS
jgi:hypothetical protein